MKKKRKEGVLVIIGGAENRTADSAIFREFVRLAGGLKARIFVSAVASGFPLETADSYLEVFRRLGVAEVAALDITEREHGNDRKIIKLVERAIWASELTKTRRLSSNPTFCESSAKAA